MSKKKYPVPLQTQTPMMLLISKIKNDVSPGFEPLYVEYSVSDEGREYLSATHVFEVELNALGRRLEQVVSHYLSTHDLVTTHISEVSAGGGLVSWKKTIYRMYFKFSLLPRETAEKRGML